MNQTEIQAFIAVAQLQSFLSAARMLETNQSSISQRVASLERQLNVNLFERSTRSVQLSAEGQRFMPYAERLLDSFMDAKEAMLVGTPPCLKGHILPTIDPVPVFTALNHIWRSFVDIEIDIQTSTGHEAIQGIQNRLIDFAILPPPDITGVRLRSTTLLTIKERVSAYVATNHSLSRRRKLTLQGLSDTAVPLVYLTLWWKRPRQLIALQRAAKSSCEMPVDVGVSWCIAGNGVMFLNAGYARRHIESGTLVPLHISDLPQTYRIMHLVKPRTLPVSTPLKEFCEVMQSTGRVAGVEVTSSL